MESKNKFSIKIIKDSAGNELSLSEMPLEAAAAFKLFVENLYEFARLTNISVNNDVKLSIKNGSILSELVYPSDRVDINEKINQVINGESNDNDLIKCFKGIQDKVKQNGLEYSITHYSNGETVDLTSRFKGRKFPLRRSQRIEWRHEVEFISGRLFNAGGRVYSNIHIDIQEVPIKIDCSKVQAKAVNKYLYEIVYLSVLKKTKISNETKYTLLDYYSNQQGYEYYKSKFTEMMELNKIDKYTYFHDLVFENLKEKPKDDGLKEIRKFLRLINNHNSEPGMLRTALVALKSFKNDVIIKSELDAISVRLKEITSTNKV